MSLPPLAPKVRSKHTIHANSPQAGASEEEEEPESRLAARRRMRRAHRTLPPLSDSKSGEEGSTSEAAGGEETIPRSRRKGRRAHKAQAPSDEEGEPAAAPAPEVEETPVVEEETEKPKRKGRKSGRRTARRAEDADLDQQESHTEEGEEALSTSRSTRSSRRRQKRKPKETTATATEADATYTLSSDGDSADGLAEDDIIPDREEEGAIHVPKVPTKVQSRQESSKESNVVFVEGVDGGFRTVSSRGAAKTHGIAALVSVPPAQERKPMGSDERLAEFVDSIWRGFGRVAVFCQGCLAGIALYHLYATYIIFGASPSFLSYYAAIASDTQNAVRVLVSVSLVASIDKTRLYFRLSTITRKERMIAMATTVFYALAYIFTIINIAGDQGLDNMAKTINFGDATAIPNPFPDPYPGFSIVTWHGLNVLRLLFSVLSFAFVCYGLALAVGKADRVSTVGAKSDVVSFSDKPPSSQLV